MIITRKIQLLFSSEGEEYQKNWKTLRDVSYWTYKAANRVVNQLYLLDAINGSVKEINDDFREKIVADKKKGNREVNDAIENLFGTSLKNTSYRVLGNEKFGLLAGGIKACISDQIEKTYRQDKKEMMKGDRSIRNYRRGMPIPFSKTSMQFFEDNGEIKFNFFPRKYGITFRLAFGRDRSNNKAIIRNILSDEYQPCDSSIQIKDNKIFLLLVIKIPQKQLNLDINNVVGADLGVNVPIYAATNKGPARRSLGSREGFLMPRLRIQAQRKALQKNLRFVKGGKGRLKKLKRLQKLKISERDTVTTMNHLLSKALIDFALDNKAGLIRLENLKGIARGEKQIWILRNWSYFQLQKFIEYKAEKYGIKVEYINPKYTSQVCHCCKKLGNRDSQKTFLCVNKECKLFDTEIMADFNAARNIATGGFSPEQIAQYKLQKSENGAAPRPEAEDGSVTRQAKFTSSNA